jgi:hypothetical protein
MWVCDKCGQLINSPKEGYVEWYEDETGSDTGFKILHSARFSPFYPSGLCSFHFKTKKFMFDYNLSDLIDADGLAFFLGYFQALKFKDKKELFEIIRRLHIPYYEEARLYWKKAIKDGFFDGADGAQPYLQSTLIELIKKYSGKN